MLKNKFKIITLLTVIMLALTLPIVRAENETADSAENPEVTATENTSNDATSPAINSTNTNAEGSNSNSDNFKREDVYLAGDNVTIDYIIDGNLFVFANHVTINSQVGGDAFICANSVTVGEQGYIFSNLFAFSKDVTIDGVVYDLYSASQNTTINGYVYRDIRTGSNTVNIFGTIGRNAYVDCANLNFVKNTNTEEESDDNSNGIINGNLKYSAQKEASIPEGSVTGETTFSKGISLEDSGSKIQEQIMSLGVFVVTVIAIWLLCLWLAPKFLKENTSLLTTKKIVPVIAFGILTPIAGIALTILLLVLSLTAKLALLLALALLVLMIISSSIFIITVNTIICNKLKIEKTMITLGVLIASSVVLWGIRLIPYIGSLVSFVSVVLGLGILVTSIVSKVKTLTPVKEETK